MASSIKEKKIIILGCSGSGKSTFAKKLHELCGIKLYHLDNIWWKRDRSHISRREFDEKLAEILAEDEWIIDGDYSRTYESRIRACDLVIFLDYDKEVCLEGIRERVGRKRSDIPWIESEVDPELLQLVEEYPEKQRPLIYELLNRYPDKKRLTFKNRQEAKEWLTAYE